MTGVREDAEAAVAVENNILQVKKLKGRTKEKSRELYQEIFSEDSEAFVDYYYKYKAAENEIYGVVDERETLLSMLHLNPCQICLGGVAVSSQYIVAVATREDYRHQGLMSRLIHCSLRDMYEKKEPFTFLMPAAEAIYRPFDFRFIYRQCQYELKTSEYKSGTELSCRPATEQDLKELSVWAQRRLREDFCTYVMHTEPYFRQMLAEQASQQGQVMLITEADRICGYFFTACEGGAEVREPIIEKRYLSRLPGILTEYFGGDERIRVFGGSTGVGEEDVRQTPMIMARVVHLAAFVKCLSAKRTVSFEIEIEDSLIKENRGVFRLTIDCKGGYLERLTDREAAWKMTAGEFTSLAFGSVSVQELHAPEAEARQWGLVNGFSPVMINEVV